MIDLPLRWVGYSRKGEGRSPQSKYATMEVAPLIRLLRPMIDSIAAKNCIAAFWVYGPRLPDTLEVIKGCGFTYTTELVVWDKEGGFGQGKTTRKEFENLWGTKRGGGLRIRNHAVSQRVRAPRGKHSEKPDAAYHALERLYGDVRRIDLFATKERPGWAVWGNAVAGKKSSRRLTTRRRNRETTSDPPQPSSSG
jgi:N6-adenosine-specific RNA methylase IME4